MARQAVNHPTRMNIDWSKIGQEDKAKCFWEAVGVVGVVDGYEVYRDGRCAAAAPSLVAAELFVGNKACYEIRQTVKYPPLTLDALFEWAVKENIQPTEVHFNGVSFAARCGLNNGGEVGHPTATSALVCAILRFKGHTVI